MWGQFLPRPSVALVVIFGLESSTLEGKPSSFYLIRHEPMFGGKLNPSLLDLKHLNYSDLSFNNFFASPILEFLGSIKSLTSTSSTWKSLQFALSQSQKFYFSWFICE